MSETSSDVELTTDRTGDRTDEGTGGEDAVEETVVVQESGSVVTDDLSLAAEDSAEDETDNVVGAGSEDAESDSTATDGVESGAESNEDEADDEANDEADDEGSDGGSENPLEVEAEVAADYLEELLDIADLDGDIDTFIEGDRAHVSIVSESKVLVGPDGAVLDALQELTRLAVMTETGDRSRLMLDVAGYREERRQQLVKVAGSAVERVRGGDARVALEPMNPFERKIVHDAVAAAGLTSESEGEEPRRRVVVLPA